MEHHSRECEVLGPIRDLPDQDGGSAYRGDAAARSRESSLRKRHRSWSFTGRLQKAGFAVAYENEVYGLFADT
jgi:hypothetical protein